MAARERLFKSDLIGVRADHLARYRWAADRLGGKGRVIDAACGCGYGSAVLADAGCRVTAIDQSQEALAYGRKHWARPGITWKRLNLSVAPPLPAADAVVSFETLEHLKGPKTFLKAAHKAAPRLLLSVPNETAFPWATANNPYHFRHYTRAELDEQLEKCGWRVREWFGQRDKFSLVWPDLEDGRTLVVDAERIE